MIILLQGALVLAVVLLAFLCKIVQDQRNYISSLESIQIDRYEKSTDIEIIELCAEKYIDEKQCHKQTHPATGELAIFRKELMEEIAEKLWQSNLIKIDLHTTKDESGQALPLWECLLKARLRVAAPLPDAGK